jgi:hypothetical protein
VLASAVPAANPHLPAPAAAARTAPSIQEALDAELTIDVRTTEPIIDDAEVAGDGETATKARQELDILLKELASAYGLGGRNRRTPDHVERARKAVTRRIRDAVARITARRHRLN